MDEKIEGFVWEFRTVVLILGKDDEGWSSTVVRRNNGNQVFGCRDLSTYGLVTDVFNLVDRFSLKDLFLADPSKTMHLLEVYCACMMDRVRKTQQISQQNIDAFDELLQVAREIPNGSSLVARLEEMKKEYQELGFPIE